MMPPGSWPYSGGVGGAVQYPHRNELFGGGGRALIIEFGLRAGPDQYAQR